MGSQTPAFFHPGSHGGGLDSPLEHLISPLLPLAFRAQTALQPSMEGSRFGPGPGLPEKLTREGQGGALCVAAQRPCGLVMSAGGVGDGAEPAASVPSLAQASAVSLGTALGCPAA